MECCWFCYLLLQFLFFSYVFEFFLSFCCLITFYNITFETNPIKRKFTNYIYTYICTHTCRYWYLNWVDFIRECWVIQRQFVIMMWLFRSRFEVEASELRCGEKLKMFAIRCDDYDDDKTRVRVCYEDYVDDE